MSTTTGQKEAGMARNVKPPEERKREIVEMAKKLFAEQGYEKTQINDITNALNVSHGLVYHYFKSKSEVFDAVIDSLLEYGSNAVLNVVEDTSLNPEEKFRKWFSLANEQPVDMARILDDILGNNEMLDRIALRKVETFAPLMEKLIKEGCEKGYFNCKYPKLAASFCMYGGLGMKNHTQDTGMEVLTDFLNDMYSRVLGINKAVIV